MARRTQIPLAAALAVMSIVVRAQYPDRPLRLAIPFPVVAGRRTPPGSTTMRERLTGNDVARCGHDR